MPARAEGATGGAPEALRPPLLQPQRERHEEPLSKPAMALSAFVALQAMRVAAVLSLIKLRQGVFPWAFWLVHGAARFPLWP